MHPDNNSNLNSMSTQPQQLNNDYQQPIVQQQATVQQPLIQPPKKNNKLIIIIVILVVVGIIGAILVFANQDKEESSNNKTHTAEKEKNNNENKDDNKVDKDNSNDKNNKTDIDSSSNNKVDNDNSTDNKNNNNNKDNNSSNNNSTNNNEEKPTTPYDETGDFLFSIDDVFTITDKGTYVNGEIERGKVKVGDTVQIIGLNKETLTTEVVSIERFRKSQNEAKYGETVSIWLKDIAREQVQRGQVLAKTNSIVAATKFDADVHILSKDEGGRHTPFFDEYRPQFYFRAIDITGKINLPESIEMVNPGENVSFTVELIHPIAIENGTKFSIREGGRTIGTGTVTKVY